MKENTKKNKLTYGEFWSRVRERIRLDCSYNKENPSSYNKDLFIKKTKELSPVAKRLWELGKETRAKNLNFDPT